MHSFYSMVSSLRRWFLRLHGDSEIHIDSPPLFGEKMASSEWCPSQSPQRSSGWEMWRGLQECGVLKPGVKGRAEQCCSHWLSKQVTWGPQLSYQRQTLVYRIDKKTSFYYSTGNDIQYPVINCNAEEYKKECIYVYITKSLGYTAEINTIL